MHRSCCSYPRPLIASQIGNGACWLLGLWLLCGCSHQLPQELGPSLPQVEVSGAAFSPVPGSGLDLESVRCLSANAAVLANLTEIERGLAAEFYNDSCCIPANIKCLQQELLMLRTAEKGNEAAASAVDVFLKLAEAKAQRPILEASLQELASMRADLEELRSHQLPIDQEPGVLDRQHIALREQLQTLDARMLQGWLQLRMLLGEEWMGQELPTLESPPISSFAIPNREEAIQTAFHMRPELRTLQTMIHRLTPDTIAMARAILQQYEASLGTVQPMGLGVKLQQLWGVVFFWGTSNCPLPSQVREVEVRTIQLTELLRKREQAIAVEVGVALLAWQSAWENWETAQQRKQSWQEQLARLTEKKPVDDNITTFDLAQARLGILEAESDSVKFQFEIQKAQLQLWMAQGITAVGCGLPGHEPFYCDHCQTTHGLLPVGEISAPETMHDAMPTLGSIRPSFSPVIPFQKCRPLSTVRQASATRQAKRF